MVLKNEVFVCIDCETTGLDVEKDRVIEVACVTFTIDGILHEYETLINPECAIPEASRAIHNIDTSMLQDKPKIHEILPHLLPLIDNYTIIGHGVAFDIELIHRAATLAQMQAAVKTRPFIDTLRLARLYGDSPNNSLSNLARHFNVEIEGIAHRAMTDVKMNIEVFKHLVRKYKTLNEVFQVLSKPIKMKYMPLGKYKGRLFSELPLQYLHWAITADFDDDLHHSLKLELNKRKKGGQFSQATNPFLGL
jgi:DNA polymerase III subunit epsilon